MNNLAERGPWGLLILLAFGCFMAAITKTIDIPKWGQVRVETTPQRLALVLTGVAAMALGIPGTLGAFAPENGPSQGTPRFNGQIVLDSSASMRAPFAGATKLEMAASAIEKYVARRREDNLALRSYGGGCNQTELLVDFKQDAGDEIAAAVDSQEPVGTADLAGAVIAATSDFSNLKLPRSASTWIFVIVGSEDTCNRNPERAIAQRLSEIGKSVDIRWRFIGVDISSQEKRQVRKTASAVGATSEDLSFVENDAELDKAIEALPVSISRPFAGRVAELIKRTGNRLVRRVEKLSQISRNDRLVYAGDQLAELTNTGLAKIENYVDGWSSGNSNAIGRTIAPLVANGLTQIEGLVRSTPDDPVGPSTGPTPPSPSPGDSSTPTPG